MTQRIWLITGVSSGFGRHLTEQLLDRGDRVIGTVRRPESVADLTEKYPDLLRVEVLDVRDTAALRAVVDRTVADFGRIDVADQQRRLRSVRRRRGTQRRTGRRPSSPPTSPPPSSSSAPCCPTCGSRGGGRIIQMSSYGGQVAFPGNSLYHATKWGIEGFCESVAQEVAPFGIGVTIVEPGGARTEFRYGSAQVADPLPDYAGTPARSFEKMLDPANGLAAPATPPAWPPPSSTASTDTRRRCGWCSDHRPSTAPSARSRAHRRLRDPEDLAASTDYPPGE